MRFDMRWALLAGGLLLVGAESGWAQPAVTASQDPRAGASVFTAKGCVTCHAISGAGGKVGPDLARISRPRSFFDLAAGMWNHLPRMAERMQQVGVPRPKLEVDRLQVVRTCSANDGCACSTWRASSTERCGFAS